MTGVRQTALLSGILLLFEVGRRSPTAPLADSFGAHGAPKTHSFSWIFYGTLGLAAIRQMALLYGLLLLFDVAQRRPKH